MSDVLPKEDMAGWLALHDLTVTQCLRLLEGYPLPDDSQTQKGVAQDRALVPGLSAIAAWDLVAEAVAMLVPEASSCVRQQASVCFDPAQRRAFTLQDAGGGVLLVACPWSGRARDLLTLAHEFGHAAQIMASPPGVVLPPVLRETCAFLAEAALVHHAERQASHRQAPVLQAPVLQALWQADTQRWLGRQARSLRQALIRPTEAYDYDWNYPVARALAIGLHQNAPVAIPSLFAGRLSVSDTLARIAVKG